VTFPFDPKAARDMSPLAEVRGKQIVYLRELQETNPAPAGAQSAPPGNTPPAGGPPAGGRAQGAAPGGRGAGGRQQASSLIEGFSTTDPKDFDIRIENRKTGAGIRITGDRPLWRIDFWSIRTTVCPEAYVEVKADPGKETSWRLTLDFYTVQ
jgi:hypothetical protein